MGMQATRNVAEELDRLNAAAERAGLSLGCPHQSAEEFHLALIRRYLAGRAGRRHLARACAVAAATLAVLLILS